jgi:hypothetical protein
LGLAAWEKLKVFRQKEWEWLHQDNTRSWAELEALEPRIRRYPILAALFDDLKQRRAERMAQGLEKIPKCYR